MSGRLQGKVCAITGATGIAEAAALRFAAEGAHVHVVTVVDDDGRRLAEAMARAGAAERYGWSVADLRDEQQAEAAFAEVRTRHGRLDALLAAVGGSGRPLGDAPLHEIALDGWHRTLALNLDTAFLSAREALRIMLSASPTSGSIVFVSSVAATNPVPGVFNTLAYSAAKGGINALTVNGASQYAHAGIRFNAIAPALTVTPMAKRAASDPDTLEVVKARMGVSGGGPLSADDHAQAAVFLCSDESRHVTGQIIRVDGGWGVS